MPLTQWLDEKTGRPGRKQLPYITARWSILSGCRFLTMTSSPDAMRIVHSGQSMNIYRDRLPTTITNITKEWWWEWILLSSKIQRRRISNAAEMFARSNVSCLIETVGTGLVRKDIQLLKLVPTFPWIDNCLMVTEQDFRVNRSASRMQGECKASARRMQAECKANARGMQGECKANARRIQGECKANARRIQSECKANARQMHARRATCYYYGIAGDAPVAP